MSKPELTKEELRRWSAEVLMGWIKKPPFPDYWIDSKTDKFPVELKSGYIDQGGYDGYELEQEEWAPDLDTSPARQILKVIEKMRERGWYVNLDNKCYQDKWGVSFQKTTYTDNYVSEELSFGLATIKAAHAALSQQGD